LVCDYELRPSMRAITAAISCLIDLAGSINRFI
jgi:hypothetical protein